MSKGFWSLTISSYPDSQLFSVFPTNKSCSGAVDSTVVSQQEGPGFDSELGPSCVEFALSTHVCLVSLCVLWLLLTGYSKMPIGLNGCFFSPCVSPAINWQPIEGVPHDLPNVSWDQLKPPTPLLRTSGYR